MRLRAVAALAALLLSMVAVAAPVPASYAASSCQGLPATIESSSGTVMGTEGNDVIVATGPSVAVYAQGGNDLVCVVGGKVSTGDGDDSVLSTAPARGFTEVTLDGGDDAYINARAGRSRVYVSEVTGVHVDLGPGGGDVWLDPTSTPGTGSVDFGPEEGHLFAFGESEAHVDLEHHRAGVDNLLNIRVDNVYDASARGIQVRMTGNAFKNDLAAYGCDVVIRGGDGRDILHKIGGGSDRGVLSCTKRHFRSLLKGGAGPDRLSGRASDDVLIGGTGHDVANGAGGVDTCRTEVRKNCER
jgi:Ca2+-binding RTX toxin-like protein